MHELDLARDIVDTVTDAAAQAGAVRVTMVRLRLGAYAGVEGEALQFAWDEATSATIAEGAQLQVIDVPLVVWCAWCLKEVRPVALNHLLCPQCGTAAGEIREGRDLEIESMEVEP